MLKIIFLRFSVSLPQVYEIKHIFTIGSLYKHLWKNQSLWRLWDFCLWNTTIIWKWKHSVADWIKLHGGESAETEGFKNVSSALLTQHHVFPWPVGVACRWPKLLSTLPTFTYSMLSQLDVTNLSHVPKSAARLSLVLEMFFKALRCVLGSLTFCSVTYFPTNIQITVEVHFSRMQCHLSSVRVQLISVQVTTCRAGNTSLYSILFSCCLSHTELSLIWNIFDFADFEVISRFRFVFTLPLWYRCSISKAFVSHFVLFCFILE